MKSGSKNVDISNLIEERYGKETSQAVGLFLQLDMLDKGRTIGYMEEMLKADKYAPKIIYVDFSDTTNATH